MKTNTKQTKYKSKHYQTLLLQIKNTTEQYKIIIKQYYKISQHSMIIMKHNKNTITRSNFIVQLCYYGSNYLLDYLKK